MTLAWLAAFAWTIALELPVYTVLAGDRFRAWWAPIALTLALNALTHPLLWFALPRFAPYAWYVVVGESAVIAVEALVLAMLGVRRPLVAATVANLTSAGVGGLVLHAF